MKFLLSLSFASVVFVVLSLPASAQDRSDGSAVETIERLTAAFNAHDIDSMLTLVHPDVQWLSVNGDNVAVEVSGAELLGKSMEQYFSAIPSARTTTEAIMEAGRFVSVWERAHWTGKNGPQSQTALAVYEVVEGRVKNVWYYPAQK